MISSREGHVAEFDSTPRRALRKAVVSPSEPAPNPLAARKGSSSADAVKKPKTISVKVKVPKELRKRLKREAEEQGISVDDLIARRLGA
jgi:hypothetical protein